MKNNKIKGSVMEPSTPRVINTDNFEVGIHDDNKTGWFYHHKYGDEFGGGLWFENKHNAEMHSHLCGPIWFSMEDK